MPILVEADKFDLVPADPDAELIARPRAMPAQPSRDRRAELQHPTPHRFIGDVESALGEQILSRTVGRASEPTMIRKIGFALDSPLEGSGFEPSVPP
jgi:hypothetical protein